jgi:hypothetical protein
LGSGVQFFLKLFFAARAGLRWRVGEQPAGGVAEFLEGGLYDAAEFEGRGVQDAGEFFAVLVLGVGREVVFHGFRAW